jgi:hypothetical protein
MSSFLNETTAEQGDAASDLLFAALQTMLSHGSEYLRTIDLGRLSICSKTTSLMMTESLRLGKRSKSGCRRRLSVHPRDDGSVQWAPQNMLVGRTWSARLFLAT